MRRWSFAKGHGTENDFVILLDRENQLDLGPAEVRFLCDRRAGIGADGVLRAVSARRIDGWAGEGDPWFMDYRNADGSVAEMCGNGIRVFARYLLDAGLAADRTIPVATRAGLRTVRADLDGTISADLGTVRLTGIETLVTTTDGRGHTAVGADVGNPHAVAFVDDVAAVPLHQAPSWSPASAYPEGVNVEFVQILGPRHITMRVYERGSGETRSCGTGTVAAAAATRDRLSDEPSGYLDYRVDVPGGTLVVGLGPISDGTADAALTGPAVLVAHGEVTLPPPQPRTNSEEN